jgi:hypothetical protein
MFNCPHCDAALGEAERQAGKCHVCGGFLSRTELESEDIAQTLVTPPPRPKAPAPSVSDIARSIVGADAPPGRRALPAIETLPAKTAAAGPLDFPPSPAAPASAASAQEPRTSAQPAPAASGDTQEDVQTRVSALWSDGVSSGAPLG